MNEYGMPPPPFADRETESGREVKGLLKGCPVGGGPESGSFHHLSYSSGENRRISSLGDVQCQVPRRDRRGREHTGGGRRVMWKVP